MGPLDDSDLDRLEALAARVKGTDPASMKETENDGTPTPPPPEGTYTVGSGVPAQYAEYWEALKPEVLLALIEEIRRARAKRSSASPDATRPAVPRR